MMNDHNNWLTWETYAIPPAQANEGSLEFEARLHAAYWHRNQKRKYTGEPYIVHPAEVVSLVRQVPHTEEMLAAAWLHDVVEDCEITHSQVHEITNHEVGQLVVLLTDISTPEMGNRAARKAIDLRFIQHYGTPESKTIKLADIISNSRSILANDPNFSKVYLPEKRALLEVLKDGDPTLWAMADKICTEAGY